MDESSDCHTEWSKSDKGQISYDITYMWILKNKKKKDTNELTKQEKTDRHRKKFMVTKGDGGGGGKIN